MPTTDVTVIVPIKDSVDVVPSLVRRLVALGDDLEVLVVDDASVDGTKEALQVAVPDLAGISVLDGPGRGVAAARNFAVGAATGEYLWFADCDDEWEPHIVTRLLHSAREHDADLVLCDAVKQFVTSGAEELIADSRVDNLSDGADVLRALLRGEVQGHLWNKLIRRRCLASEPFPPTRAHSDLGGVLRALPQVSRVARRREALYRYQVHDGSILNSRSYRWEDLTDCLDTALAVSKQMGLDPTDDDLRAFTCTHVVLPLLHESVRRRSRLRTEELGRLQGRCASMISWTDLSLLRRRGYLVSAVELATLLVSRRLYTRLYAMYRARQWSALDRL